MSDIFGGFTNRFQFFWAESPEGSPLIAIPPPIDRVQWDTLLDTLKKMMIWLSYFPHGQEFKMSYDAEQLYKQFYDTFTPIVRWKLSNETEQALLMRCVTNVVKNALIFMCLRAATEGGAEYIEKCDIEAGIGISMYSARCMLDIMGSLATGERAKLDARIAEVLKKTGKISARLLHERVGGRWPASEVQMALKSLVQLGVIKVERDGRRTTLQWKT